MQDGRAGPRRKPRRRAGRSQRPLLPSPHLRTPVALQQGFCQVQRGFEELTLAPPWVLGWGLAVVETHGTCVGSPRASRLSCDSGTAPTTSTVTESTSLTSSTQTITITRSSTQTVTRTSTETITRSTTATATTTKSTRHGSPNTVLLLYMPRLGGRALKIPAEFAEPRCSPKRALQVRSAGPQLGRRPGRPLPQGPRQRPLAPHAPAPRALS